MPLFLLANWRWLLPSLIAIGLGIWVGVVKLEVAGLHATIANMKAADAQELAAARQIGEDAEKRAHDADLRADKAAADGEAQHAKDLADIDAGNAAWTNRLRAARATGSGRCNVPAPPTNPSQPAQPAPRGDGGRAGDDPANSLRDTALKLQADVRECVLFLQQVGK